MHTHTHTHTHTCRITGSLRVYRSVGSDSQRTEPIRSYITVRTSADNNAQISEVKRTCFSQHFSRVAIYGLKLTNHDKSFVKQLKYAWHLQFTSWDVVRGIQRYRVCWSFFCIKVLLMNIVIYEINLCHQHAVCLSNKGNARWCCGITDGQGE